MYKKISLKTESSNRVIRFNPIQSCGSTSDSVVRPLTQLPSTPTESMTEPSFKTMHTPSVSIQIKIGISKTFFQVSPTVFIIESN